jgi:tRNA (cytidine/uridine-2'-O-)-methyltransferase
VDVVLVAPEIPQNTGSVGRVAAATGVRLHLVEPLGFSLEDRYLKRAGLDYWPLVDLVVHRDWAALVGRLSRDSERPFPERMRPFSARGGRSLFETRFRADDVLVFGRESVGLDRALVDLATGGPVYVPIRPGVRSLNLSSVVCLSLYTALVSAGVPLPDNDGRYVPDPRANDGLRPQDVARRGDET